MPGVVIIIPALGRQTGGSGVQGQPLLHSQLEASEGYRRPCHTVSHLSQKESSKKDAGSRVLYEPQHSMTPPPPPDTLTFNGSHPPCRCLPEAPGMTKFSFPGCCGASFETLFKAVPLEPYSFCDGVSCLIFTFLRGFIDLEAGPPYVVQVSLKLLIVMPSLG